MENIGTLTIHFKWRMKISRLKSMHYLLINIEVDG